MSLILSLGFQEAEKLAEQKWVIFFKETPKWQSPGVLLHPSTKSNTYIRYNNKMSSTQPYHTTVSLKRYCFEQPHLHGPTKLSTYQMNLLALGRPILPRVCYKGGYHCNT